MNQKQHYKEQLDKIQKDESRRLVTKILFISFLAITAYLLWIFYIGSNETIRISGKAITLHDETTKRGSKVFIVIELPDGEIVRAIFPSNAGYINNGKVILEKISTKLFAAKRYRFIGFDKDIGIKQ